jgi:23S rRNA pseudouridine1911/1915/1917 synthase
MSRSRVKTLIDESRLRSDTGPVTQPAEAVRAGGVYILDVPPPIAATPLPQVIPFTILYEDSDLIVLDKPAGLVVHPAPGNLDGTLVNALLAHCGPGFTGIGAERRPGIVHRLDKDTSGVMVVARTLPAHTALIEQLSSREVHRQYLAVVVGALVSGGTANAPIDRHPRDRIRMAVRDDGKDAVTHFRLRERFRAHTLLECRLETGRTHQIRVHMQHLKHPIVGDPLYGGPLKLPKGATPELIEALRGFRRQALHAEVLEFAHPVTGEAVRCSAPIPDDMRALVRALHDDAVAAKQDNR